MSRLLTATLFALALTVLLALHSAVAPLAAAPSPQAPAPEEPARDMRATPDGASPDSAAPPEAPESEVRGVTISTPAEPLAPGVLIRVDGADLREEDYARYVSGKRGMNDLLDFIDDWLLEKRARELEVSVSEEAVTRTVEKEIASSIERMNGDRERYVASLAKKFYTLESWKKFRGQLLRPRLLLEACILKSRKITDKEIQERFEDDYGPGGVKTQVRQIMISKKREVPSGTPLDLAKHIMAKLEADKESFGKLVGEYSDHLPSKRNDGMLLNYRPGQKGKPGQAGAAFDEAVARLTTEGEIAGPVESEAGYHIVQLVKRATTKLEDVAGELRTKLELAAPTPREKIEFRRALRDSAKLER